MTWIPQEAARTLQSNWRKRVEADAAGSPDFDPQPVVKLFTPDAHMTWLITEQDPDEPDTLFGLADLGQGCPELGYVSLAELTTLRGVLGLAVERDRFFEAKGTIGEYAADAQAKGWLDSHATPGEASTP